MDTLSIPSHSSSPRRLGSLVLRAGGLALLFSLAAESLLPAATQNLTQYVIPFVGTAPGNTNFGVTGDNGNTFPGALCPTGLVQWSPDTTSNLPGGYDYSDTKIKGFSLTHFSGRGCVAYQDFPFMPYVGAITASPASSTMYQAAFSHSNETAQPGYYSVTLDTGLATGIKVELTATLRTGSARFTFPASPNASLIINSGGSANGDTATTGINIVSNTQITGYATTEIGCGTETYTIYFVVDFDRSFASSGTWNGSTVTNGSKSSVGAESGAFVSFDTTSNAVVNARTAISYVSLANAESNLAAENSSFNFSGIQSAANTAWNNVLNKVQVSGGTTAQLQTFYTALYHCFIHPNIFEDANGQYLGMDENVHQVASGHHQYENISGWDLYRSLIPLRAILSPAETSDILQSEVNWGAQGGGGGLPRWEQTNRNSNGMEGDGQSILIATGYACGATAFDTASALTYMENDLWEIGASSDGQPVNGDLSSYLTFGFVPTAASETLEFAEADFALAQFTQNLGDTETSKRFLALSGNWMNSYNSSSGFIQPRHSDGTWVANFSPTSGSGFAEGDSYQYTWLVPYNVAGLAAAMGGNSTCVSRLNTFFTQLNTDSNSQYCFIGNEPSEEIPWEYDFVGDPAGAQSVNRAIQTQCFTAAASGLPGNDDGGALSSWYVFSALGFYPEIPGVGGVVLGSPLFPSAVINFENGNQLTITGVNAAANSPYVQSMTVNGAASTSLWQPIGTLTAGGTFKFVLGSSASSWGSGSADAPPSYNAPQTQKFEAETLSETTSPSGLLSVQTDAEASGGAWALISCSGANQTVTFSAGSGIVQGVTYDVVVGVKMAPNHGIFQMSVNGNLHGSPVDEYSSSDAFAPVDVATFTASANGTHTFTFTCTGKDSASTSCDLAIDYIILIQQ